MAAKSKLVVLLAHCDPLLSAGLKAAFQGHEEFEVVVGDMPPHACTADIIIADFDNGVSLAVTAAPAPPVMIVSEEDGEAAAREALESGIRGYFLSRSPIESIVNGARIIVNGGVVIDPFVASQVLNNMNAAPLTKRELTVLVLLARGLTDKAIASRLGNSVGTIKSHLKRLRSKLNARSRTEAILIAQRRGLLPREILRRGDSSVTLAQFKLKRPTAGGRGWGQPLVPR